MDARLAFIVLIVGAALGYLLGSAVGIALSVWWFDVGLAELGDLDAYRSVQALKLVQAFNTTGTFLLPALLLRRLFRRPSLFSLRFGNVSALTGIQVVLLVLLLMPFIGWLAAFNEGLHLPESLRAIEEILRQTEERAATITKAFLDMHTYGELAINILLIALLAAVAEEVFFRGAMQSLLLRQSRNPHAAIWITAVLFSAFHFQFYGFLPRMLLGAMFGYLVFYSGSLWYAILAHFINNATSVLLYFLLLQGTIDPSWEEFGQRPVDALPAIVCGILGIGLFVWICRRAANGRGDISANISASD